MPDKKPELQREEPDFAELIGGCVPSVMRNAKNMNQMNVALDLYLKAVPEEWRSDPKFKEDIKKQLTLGRQAMEAALQRFMMTVG